MKKIATIVFILLSISCAKTTENDSSVKIAVSIPPQIYFVEKIAGDKASVFSILPEGKSPASYEVGTSKVLALGKSDVYFTIGVPFEASFLPKVKQSLTNLLFVDMSDGVEKINLDEHHEGEEEEERESESEAKDPHIWLSPLVMKEASANIYLTLCMLYPENKEYYKSNYESLIEELDSLHYFAVSNLSPYKDKAFFVFHPSFGYFAKEYSLKQIAVESGGKEPSASKLKDIIEIARRESVSTIFSQPEFSSKSANAVATAIGGEVLIINTLKGNYYESMKEMINTIVRGLAKTQ